MQRKNAVMCLDLHSICSSHSTLSHAGSAIVHCLNCSLYQRSARAAQLTRRCTVHQNSTCTPVHAHVHVHPYNVRTDIFFGGTNQWAYAVSVARTVRVHEHVHTHVHWRTGLSMGDTHSVWYDVHVHVQYMITLAHNGGMIR